METITLEVGASPRLRIMAVGGDLRLTGREGTVLEVQAAPTADLSLTPTADGVEVTCGLACLMFVPSGASVEAQAIGGDVRVTGLSGPLTLQTVAGDVSLRRVGPVRVVRVGGDVAVHRLEGGLQVEWVGGDVELDHIQGAVQLDVVRGDLSLCAVEGPVKVQVGGEAVVELSPPPGTTSTIEADGDLSCLLPEGMALELRLRAGGVLEAHVPGARDEDGQGVQIRMKGSQAAAELISGGDLWVGARRVGDIGAHPGLWAQVQAEIDAALAQAGAGLAGLGRFHGLGAERIRDRAHRVAERARCRAERMARRGEQRRSRWTASLDLDSWMERRSRVSDQEQLSVLQMLEQGVIGVEEAEGLLHALEGEA